MEIDLTDPVPESHEQVMKWIRSGEEKVIFPPKAAPCSNLEFDEICETCRGLEIEKALSTESKLGFDRHGDYLGTVSKSRLIEGAPACRLCYLLLKALTRSEVVCGLYPTGYEDNEVRVFREDSNGLYRDRHYEKSTPFEEGGSCFLRVVPPGSAFRKHVRYSMGWKNIHVIGSSSPSRSGTEISLVSQDAVDFEYLKECIEFCRHNHKEHCSYPQGAADPSVEMKFVDCPATLSAGSLIVRKGRLTDPFVALSYVWGPQVTKSDGQDKYKLEMLPRTVANAIAVTVRLGQQFLWVDKYCIAQDDEIEKLAMVGIMDKIYNCAELTTVAADGDRDTDGIAGVEGNGRSPQETVHTKLYSLCSSPDPPYFSVGASKWATRGWTYQEAVLSRRRIIFTAQEAIFDCQCMSERESFRNLLHQTSSTDKTIRRQQLRLKLGPEFPQSIHVTPDILGCDEYWRHVLCFNKRELTFKSDTHFAFLGIANSFRTTKRATSSICGLPFDTTTEESCMRTFAHSLCWHHANFNEPESFERVEKFPSWSWMGWHHKELGYNGLGEAHKAFTSSIKSVRLSIDKRHFVTATAGCQDLDRSGCSPILEIESTVLDVTESDIQGIIAPLAGENLIQTTLFGKKKYATCSLSVETEWRRLFELLIFDMWHLLHLGIVSNNGFSIYKFVLVRPVVLAGVAALGNEYERVGLVEIAAPNEAGVFKFKQRKIFLV